MDRLERARDEIREASDLGGRVVQQQLDTIELGIFEEDEGDLTQEEPGPKVDRIVELRQKLDGLADEAEDPAVAERIDDARDHLEAYLKDHPRGG